VAATPVIKAEEFSYALSEGLKYSHLPALDGMRAVAVFIVIFYHSSMPIPGGVGVLVFFVLSGFLITWLLLKEADRHGTVSLRKFYIRRSLRIFPAFTAYAALLITGLVVLEKRIVWPQVIASLLYVSNYYQALNGDPNTGFSHTWSLGIEEQFYVLWPSVFLLFLHQREKLVKTLATTIAAIWVYRLVLVFAFHVDQGYIYEAFDTRADSLLIGCLTAVLLWERKVPQFFNWACGNVLWPALSLTLFVASMMIEHRLGSSYRNTIGFAVDSLLVAILIPQMIAFRDSMIGGWLNWRWMRFLGVLSYSLYLYQQAAIGQAEKVAAKLPALLHFPVIITIVLLCAMASYYVVERPALKLKERFSLA
jgi:peptidoglycan/LPS O-acetylase OafA/YrhL